MWMGWLDLQLSHMSATGNGPDFGWGVVMEQAKSYAAEMTQEISTTIKEICSC